ncbi:predicted protein [Plenodomus lingam JN3]|uniref:Predicted protein n=2 Tax=Leptosphaeria maculans TaxID=5022 RepID=E5A3Y1_LEPMJ|nr:predicted protein [Plenodomus lingam JN3]CBX98326.1 predicted protein [Plenodomus lingam JN3]
MRSLFCQPGAHPRSEIPAWSSARRNSLAALLPASQTESYAQAMQRAWLAHPYAPFEQRVLSFLQHLHEGVEKPDLAQVEEGRISIDGREFSEAESRAAMHRMGL